jgi:methyltransferase family protein
VSFKADWLALREPYDRAARNRDVLAAVVESFAGQSVISVVDLACGTGSTLRALAPHLGARQMWRLVDNDLGLLARAGDSDRPAGARITTTPVDLSRDLEAALDGAVDLVTTSALLDLVSASWLERFVVETAARRLPVYAALSYDGRAVLEPAESLDAAVIAAVARHQHRDKGFGPALGPEATARAIEKFKALGYAVEQGAADWVFAAEDQQIQNEVLAGWAAAARETGELSGAAIVDWFTRRRELVAAGTASMRVGHVDFFVRPIGVR